ncbi:MAG: NADH-quinone oxidoreductase subunit C [Bacteroidota bacterium]
MPKDPNDLAQALHQTGFAGGASDGAQVDPGEEKQTLKFYFTPRVGLAGEVERLRSDNPHAKASTYLPDLAEALQKRFGDAIGEVTLYAGETTVYVSREAIVDVSRALRDEMGFDYMTDMGTIDRFTEEDRFEVFYNVLNLSAKQRLRLKVRVDEEDPVVPTVTGIWPAANWHEREAWDMMGIRFEGHSDLRRMFMPDDFEYHPARKEFPTLGIPGSLPLPPREADGELQADPFASAHADETPE